MTGATDDPRPDLSARMRRGLGTRHPAGWEAFLEPGALGAWTLIQVPVLKTLRMQAARADALEGQVRALQAQVDALRH